jgi:hypothetical protein
MDGIPYLIACALVVVGMILLLSLDPAEAAFGLFWVGAVILALIVDRSRPWRNRADGQAASRRETQKDPEA